MLTFAPQRAGIDCIRQSVGNSIDSAQELCAEYPHTLQMN